MLAVRVVAVVRDGVAALVGHLDADVGRVHVGVHLHEVACAVKDRVGERLGEQQNAVLARAVPLAEQRFEAAQQPAAAVRHVLRRGRDDARPQVLHRVFTAHATRAAASATFPAALHWCPKV